MKGKLERLEDIIENRWNESHNKKTGLLVFSITAKIETELKNGVANGS